jgi:hypothetical protein
MATEEINYLGKMRGYPAPKPVSKRALTAIFWTLGVYLFLAHSWDGLKQMTTAMCELQALLAGQTAASADCAINARQQVLLEVGAVWLVVLFLIWVSKPVVKAIARAAREA